MHEDEVAVDAALVSRLVASQFPQWSHLPVRQVRSTGTVNAIVRLGQELYARLPRVERWADHLVKECRWLPALAPHLSLSVPEPVAEGRPGDGYPFAWAIYRWHPGETFSHAVIGDEREAALDLARFVTELRRIDTSGAPRSLRDRPLSDRNDASRTAIASLSGMIDTAATAAAWESSLTAPAWDGMPVWTHGDLLPPNLLVERGRLVSVIDFGSVGAGDPAVDVIPAWSVLGREGRAVFRSALDVDDGTWARARGFALHQALLIVPYYADTNPAFARMAMRTIEHVIGDVAPGRRDGEQLIDR